MSDSIERLVELETKVQHIEEAIDKTGDTPADIRVLMRMMEEVQFQLKDFLQNGNTQCQVEHERIQQLTQRVERLEQGEFPALTALKDGYGRINEKLGEIDSRLVPLEKKILMWVGALAFITTVAPFVFRYLTR